MSMSTADMATPDEVPPPVPASQPERPATPALPAPPEPPGPPEPPVPQPIGGHATVGHVVYSLSLDFAIGVHPTNVLPAVRSVLTTAHASDPEWSADRCELLMRTSVIRWAPDASQSTGQRTLQLEVPITAPAQLPLTPPPGGRGRRQIRAPGLLRDDAGAIAAVNGVVQQLTTVARAVAELARLMNKGLDMVVVRTRLAEKFEVDSQALLAYLRSAQPAITAQVHSTIVCITKPSLDIAPVRNADAMPARLQPRPAVAKPLHLRARIERPNSTRVGSSRVRKVAVASHEVGLRALLAAANVAGVPIDGLVTEPEGDRGPNQVGHVLIKPTEIQQLIAAVTAVMQSAVAAPAETGSKAASKQSEMFVTFATRPDDVGDAMTDTKGPEGS